MDAAWQQWFLTQGRKATTVMELVDSFCVEMKNHGLHLLRANCMIRTLHPQLEFMVYTWQPSVGKRVDISDAARVFERRLHRMGPNSVEEFLVSHGHVEEEMFLLSPFYLSMRDHRGLRMDPSSEEKGAYPMLADLCSMGATDYVVLPIELQPPYTGAMSFACSEPNGFTDAQVQLLEELQPWFSICIAPLLVQSAAYVVLSTYLGRNPASQVMDGHIRLGDIAEMDAVLGFIDMRGFTKHSAQMSGTDLVEMLDAFFSVLNEVLGRFNGEILKFMGDGALFVFKLEDSELGQRCADAVDAVDALDGAMNELLKERAQLGKQVFEYGVALHYGRVMYGNVGAPTRLDFTVIGPAVNLTARLEAICTRCGMGLVVTPAFASVVPDRFSSLGMFKMRGVDGEMEVFGRKREEEGQ